MDLVYIYGPPAVGKLTVATGLAELTGYKLLHNHVTIDCVVQLFDWGTDPFWRQVRRLRDALIEEAVNVGQPLITTSVYEQAKDAGRTEARFAMVEANGGRVCPVRLICSTATLSERVTAPERRGRKLDDADALRALMAEKVLVEPVPHRTSLTLDTDLLTPEQAAAAIIDHYALPTVTPSESPAH